MYEVPSYPVLNLNAYFRLLAWSQRGLVGKGHWSPGRNTLSLSNATIHSSLGNETAFHLADWPFVWLFCQYESGGKLYKLSFLTLISISLSKLVILALTPQAHRQAWGRTATTVGNVQNTVSFLFSFPNSHTIVIKYYICWKFL